MSHEDHSADVETAAAQAAERSGPDAKESFQDTQVGLTALTGAMPFRPSSGPHATVAEAPGEIPERYEIREGEDGRELRCKEAPGVAVRIDRELALSEAEARKLGERIILLDGAGRFGPLIDDGRHLYNLDHHDDCCRAFTLATCEQALILVLKGLALDQGEWTVLANEPDLDTVMAIWVLLNYRRLRDLDPERRDRIVPLLRLEGAIDANGLELAEVCGLPRARWEAEKERLDRLFQHELEAKKSGTWSTMDLHLHTMSLLGELDREVFEASDFIDFTSVETEHGHVEIGENRVAVVCRDSAGIYDVEKRLKSVWGDRLGLIALEKEHHHYTLRRVASLSGIDLDEAYARLNLLDPVVDGRPPEKRWGGSDDIGGSPRPRGTGLTPREVAKILRLTYREVSLGERLQRLATTSLWTVALILVAGLLVIARRVWLPLPTSELSAAADLGLGGLALSLGAALLTRQLSRGWTWLFGWRWPAGEDWLALVPAILLGGALGGVGLPRHVALDAESLVAWAGAALLASLGLAMTFPGLAHGLLILESRVQNVQGSWFVSRPAWAVGGLYAGLSVLATHFWLAGCPLPLEPLWRDLVTGAGALVVGVSVSMVRERSLSILPAIGAFFAGAVARLLAGIWF